MIIISSKFWTPEKELYKAIVIKLTTLTIAIKASISKVQTTTIVENDEIK